MNEFGQAVEFDIRPAQEHADPLARAGLIGP
jgi:hypothetical protein